MTTTQQVVPDAEGRYLDALLGKRFTDEQRAVAVAPLVPTLVVAGAGSGKTTVMAARVVHAVAVGGIRPSEVLGLTFTNKAAVELRERVRTALMTLTEGSVVVDEEALDDQPTVATYHAYAATLVRDHALRIGREPDTGLLTEARRWQLAIAVVRAARGPFEHVRWQPRTVAQYVLDLDAEMSEHRVTADEVRDADAAIIAEVDAVARPTQAILGIAQAARERDELLTLVDAYRARKRELDLLDFGDQVALAGLIADRAPEVGAGERERFRCVFLDEYQDTSVAQRRLLASLFGDGHPVTAVGDPCQAIYGWRGASVGNLLRFAEHFPRAVPTGPASYDPIYLLTSFRNGGRILDAANVISTPLRERDPRGRRPYVEVERLTPAPGAEQDGEVRVGFHDSVGTEAEWLADEVRAELDSGAVEPSGVAVLCRRRADFPVFHKALAAREIPVEVVGLGGLLEMPEVDDVVSMLEVLADPTANPALMRILTGPRYRIGPRDLVALGRRASYLATGGTGRELLDAGDDPAGTAALAAATAAVDPCDVVALSDAVASLGDPARYSPEAYARLRTLDTEIARLRPLVTQPVIEAVTEVIAAIGLDVELETNPDGLAAARLANLSAFCDHAARFEGLADQTDLLAFLDFLAAARDREDGLDIGGVSNAETVKLMTVHKAKGLEWEVVAVPTLSEGTFPPDRGRSRWTGAARVLPTRLRGDRDDLPEDPVLTTPGLAAFTEAHKDDDLIEERRLAYVAVSRAKRLLIVSGHVWNLTRGKPCTPALFLDELREAAFAGTGSVVHWCDDGGEANPVLLAGVDDVGWPPSYDASAWQRRRDAATLVRAAMEDAAGDAAGDVQLTFDAAPTALSRLHDETTLLLDEVLRARAPQRVVPLPRTLSASQLVRLAADPSGLAQSLARPMPRKPSAAARRGTRFHAWLEESFGERPLLDRDVLPGAADDVVVDDDDLDALRAAFAASPYAERRPVAVEEPFELLIAGRVLRGRIDAVFAEDDGRYEVVDWKTGESGDPLQLAVYRVAWADLAGVDLDAVGAAFLHIASGRIERFDDLPDRDALAALINGINVPFSTESGG